MARLQEALMKIVEVFVEYSGADGKLSKEEFMKMMDKEIDCPEAKGKMKAAACDKTKGEMCKGNMDFDEYLQKVSCMAKCGYNKKTGKDAGCGK